MLNLGNSDVEPLNIFFLSLTSSLLSCSLGQVESALNWTSFNETHMDSLQGRELKIEG